MPFITFQGVVSSREVAVHSIDRKIHRANGDARRKLQMEKNVLIKVNYYEPSHAKTTGRVVGVRLRKEGGMLLS